MDNSFVAKLKNKFVRKKIKTPSVYFNAENVWTAMLCVFVFCFVVIIVFYYYFFLEQFNPQRLVQEKSEQLLKKETGFDAVKIKDFAKKWQEKQNNLQIILGATTTKQIDQ